MTEHGFKRLAIGLLVLNTFLICALAGAGFFYLYDNAAVPPSRLPLAGEQLASKLRGEFQKALNDARRDVRSTGLEARQARVEAAALMGKPDLDGVALADALKRAREAEYAVRAATEQKAIDFVATLSVDERRRLADGLIQREAPRPATK
ncbi:periplasmic heavy metal sensor [Agrobacterium vitis]|uniref:periplasmic heavy metal sensor n=1 Tax=Agrobacterium vitis TaxID=373 RepID=UPI0012E96BC0|nr:periplasmic heavy metal sensor [Agrobacterium vitis]MCF1452563.1 periplasmic heavy metal sensor [Agrobacterium vitis]MVA33144.1 periplasmic heavy metal sensor [Agrobacterium vitis]BCH56302.1 membrane protein [Agrobacterium vitis]